MSRLPPLLLPHPIKFGPHSIPTSQIFYVSPTRLSCALVNLRPLLPGHVLVIPVRPNVPRYLDLTVPETTDLFLTVRRVARMLDRVYGRPNAAGSSQSGMNIGIQDGAVAGQSVPHIHVHLIPRSTGDLKRAGKDKGKGGDEIYDMMESEDGDIGEAMRERESRKAAQKEWVADAERKDRTEQQMAQEAEILRLEMEKERADSEG